MNSTWSNQLGNYCSLGPLLFIAEDIGLGSELESDRTHVGPDRDPSQTGPGLESDRTGTQADPTYPSWQGPEPSDLNPTAEIKPECLGFKRIDRNRRLDQDLIERIPVIVYLLTPSRTAETLALC